MASIGVKVELEGAPQYVENMKNLSQQTKLYGEQLKRVQNQMQGSSAFAKSIAESKALQQQQEALMNQQRLLAERIKDATEKYGENSTQVARLKTQYEQLENKIISVNRELKAHGGTLGAVGAQLKEVGGKIQATSQKVTDFGKGLTTHVTLPLAAIGVKAAASFAEVDKTMQLANKTMGNTAKEANLLSDAMKKAAQNSTFGMNDAAQASLNFARAGLTAAEAANTLAPAMNLAAGEGGELDTVSAGLVATINGFAGSFEDAGRYADVFANACNNSALDINSMSQAMSVAAPIFNAAGYAIEDAALYMGAMANAGIDADTAANALKTGLARLVKPAKEGQVWMEKLGVSVTNADGSMKDSVEVQKELHEAFSTLSESEQLAAASAIFGKNQMSNWLALINTAPESIASLDSALQKEGTTMEMANAMMSGFGGSMEKLKSSIDVAATSLGEALAPTILSVSEKVQNMVTWFNSLSEAQQQTIAKVGLFVAAAGPLLTVVGMIGNGIGALATGIGVITTAISTAALPAISAIGPALAGLVTTAAPFIAIAAGIAAAVIGITEVVQHWGEITVWFGETFANVTTTASNLWEIFRTSFLTKLQEISTKWTSIWTQMQTSVKTIFTNIKNAIDSKITEVKNSITNLVTGIKTAFDELKASAFQWGKDMIQNFIDGIKAMIGKVTEAVTNVADTVKSYLHFTEPDVGPMKNFNEWPRHMMQQYAEGIDAGRYLVKNATEDVAAEVAILNNGNSLDPGEIYDAVNAGASNANIALSIGTRELTRALEEMGVVFA